MADTPSERITAALRAQIDSGALAPGDRVPSTRAIVREYGVAMATATRVLTALRREGLVRAVPGVGTVVADRPSPGPGGGAADGHAPGGGHGPGGGRVQDDGHADGGRASGDRHGGGDAVPPAGRARPGAGRNRPPGPRASAASVGRGDGGGPPAPAAAPHGPELSRERIVAAAVDAADRDGLRALSMRRVAGGLGAATMSLYRYFPSKDDLVAAMYDRVLAETALPEPPPSDWREATELTARRQWELYRAHPWVPRAMMFTRPIAAPHAMAVTDWGVRALSGLGLDERTMTVVSVTVSGFVRGFAVDFEAEAEARRDTGMTGDEWTEAQGEVFRAIVDRNGLHGLRYMVESGDDDDFSPDRLFEFGLSRLLDGIALLVDAHGGAAGPPRPSPQGAA